MRNRLVRSARKVMKNAYAPFSEFKVGAAVLTSQGKVFVGCNVENSSYGMTNCAERTAIFSAVAKVVRTRDSGGCCSQCDREFHARLVERAGR